MVNLLKEWEHGNRLYVSINMFKFYTTHNKSE